jgi:hypothetical protein
MHVLIFPSIPSIHQSLHSLADLSEEPEDDSGISQSMPDDSYMSGYRPGGAEPMSPATPDRIVATDLRRRLGAGAGGGGTRRLRFVSESDDSSASTLTEVSGMRRWRDRGMRAEMICLLGILNEKGNILSVYLR